jgi:predicted aspartyl protease
LTKVGRVDDAIDWSYKSLAVMPKLVDLRGKLAKLLVLQKKYYEALALLGSFDAEMRAAGQPAYFEGQRIAIETALARNSGASPTERTSLRLPSFGGHFFAPVTMGEARPVPFVVDTGATTLTVSEEHLDRSKVPYKLSTGSCPGKLADGRKVSGRRVTIQALRVGPYELKDVSAFVCRDCALLCSGNRRWPGST